MSQLLEAHNIVKGFRNIVAVNDISLSLPEGKITALLGANGSGKTTFMRVLAGLVQPQEGYVDYNIICSRSPGKTIKSLIGYMPQRFHLYDELTVMENLNFVAKIKKVDNSQERIQQLMEKFGLDNYKDAFAGKLSGGWRQKLSFSATLLPQPILLILDEPTAGVDFISRQTFWNELNYLKQAGVTILLSTHYMDELERADKISYFSSGKKIYEGDPNLLTEELNIRSWMIVIQRSSDIIPIFKNAFNNLMFDWQGSKIIVRGQHITDETEKELDNFIQQHGGILTPIPPKIQDGFILLSRSHHGNS